MRIAVVCGGRSTERAVSLRSGARVELALQTLGHEAVLIDADTALQETVLGGDFDVVFIALHGRGGEDGQVQAQLELLGIPYTGSRSGPCTAAFHKARAKRLLLAAGVNTPPFLTVSATAIEAVGPEDALDEAATEVGFPLVVKPARGGSALGTRFVADADELPRALMGAMSYDLHVVVERHVHGRELSITLVGAGDDVRVLPAVEIVPRHSDWFDYESRYTRGETEFACPPDDIPDDVLAGANETARRAYEALDCSGFGRVDLIVDKAGTPWVLEVATVPGLTETSLTPMSAQAAGISLAQLVDGLLHDALARAREDAPSM